MKKHTKCLSVIFLNLLLGLGAFNFQNNLNAMEDVRPVTNPSSFDLEKLPPVDKVFFNNLDKKFAQMQKTLNKKIQELKKRQRELKRSQNPNPGKIAKIKNAIKRNKLRIVMGTVILSTLAGAYTKGVYESGSWKPWKAFPAFGKWFFRYSLDSLKSAGHWAKNAFNAARKAKYESQFPAQKSVIDQSLVDSFSGLDNEVLKKCANTQKLSECYANAVSSQLSAQGPIAPISPAPVSTPPFSGLVQCSADSVSGLNGKILEECANSGIASECYGNAISSQLSTQSPIAPISPAPAPISTNTGPRPQFPGQGFIHRGDVEEVGIPLIHVPKETGKYLWGLAKKVVGR